MISNVKVVPNDAFKGGERVKVLRWTSFTFNVIQACRKERIEEINIIYKPMYMY